jgi:hypothetical protein
MRRNRDRNRDARASKPGNNGSNRPGASGASDQHRLYDRAFRLDESGKCEDARKLYVQLDADGVDPGIRAEAINSLAVLDGLEDRHYASLNGFKRALSIDPNRENARRNLLMLESCGYGEHPDCDVDP